MISSQRWRLMVREVCKDGSWLGQRGFGDWTDEENDELRQTSSGRRTNLEAVNASSWAKYQGRFVIIRR